MRLGGVAGVTKECWSVGEVVVLVGDEAHVFWRTVLTRRLYSEVEECSTEEENVGRKQEAYIHQVLACDIALGRKWKRKVNA